MILRSPHGVAEKQRHDMVQATALVELDMDYIVSKRMSDPYEQDTTWFKVLNRVCSSGPLDRIADYVGGALLAFRTSRYFNLYLRVADT